MLLCMDCMTHSPLSLTHERDSSKTHTPTAVNQLPLSRSRSITATTAIRRSIARHLALTQAFLVFTPSPCPFARKIKISETRTKDCWLSRQNHYLARDRSHSVDSITPHQHQHDQGKRTNHARDAHYPYCGSHSLFLCPKNTSGRTGGYSGEIGSATGTMIRNENETRTENGSAHGGSTPRPRS
ncbi:hypothetical protein F5148DRAFT_399732 [Russula earlei]|uniref:Uncharacterized protein n=1 Tax=Russula earlei TaxID=71964 RepID=A0ACC0U001_9AGAM|nr:hypothetical protein F5148DRAFT_399732 [Russula earlei]